VAVTTGDPSGWRHGLVVLATGGMVAWITAWDTGVLPADSSSPTLPGPAPHHEEGIEPAWVSFPPAAATQIVRVLTQLTLPHTRLLVHEQEVVPP
jgi:hypothetical protein